jgi:hypothetical protein
MGAGKSNFLELLFTCRQVKNVPVSFCESVLFGQKPFANSSIEISLRILGSGTHLFSDWINPFSQKR